MDDRRFVKRGGRIVGIDLGTTNTVLAAAPVLPGARAEVLAVPQLVGEGRVAAAPLLPSTLFSPPPGEPLFDPWGDAPWIIGAHARARGEKAPGRAVSSPKSWLCHAAIDRLAPVLPWGGDPDDPTLVRISPVEASRRILSHSASALRETLGAELSEQELVLTVPASFDQIARELTLRAAHEAGLSVRLLEEPIAAFHDYLSHHGTDELGSLVSNARPEVSVLVCDVGGGTTDLTLVRVRREGASIRLDRVAVGRHVLLGGDNMDLALAHLAESRLAPPSERLTPTLFAELVLACRAAKERLLGERPPESVEVRLLPGGSRLVGAVLATALTREEVLTTVLDGFFPIVQRSAAPVGGRSALVAFGLPYERDPAITRHVAAFLARHLDEGTGPHAVLLNGGVFHSGAVTERVLSALARLSGAAPRVLAAPDPELAVARGAVAFGLALHGHGPRIGGGSARGYYVGLARSDGTRRAVCVVPRGSSEGERHVVRSSQLSLVVGQPARFDLFASDRAVHAPGEVVSVDDALDALPSMVASFDTEGEARRHVAVHLEGELSAIGTLDVACVETTERAHAAPRHRLAFDLRGERGTPSTRPPTSQRAPEAKLAAALALIVDVFGPGRADADPRAARHLVRELERVLGDRPSWNTETTRTLFDALAKEPRARKRSPDHERAFWMLAGYCLRPGFGHPRDDERAGRLVPLFREILSFPSESRNFQQFWIAWRRVAGGLREPMQLEIRELVDPFLSTDPDKPKKKKGFRPLAEDEMLELASSLERAPKERRASLGRWVLERTWTNRDPRLWTALARIGARAPTYGSAHHVVPPSEVSRWLDHLLREKWGEVPGAARAAAQMARLTGDRTRDVSEPLRGEIGKRLVALGAPAEWVTTLFEVVPLTASEPADFFGESLPAGLVLGAPGDA